MPIAMKIAPRRWQKALLVVLALQATLSLGQSTTSLGQPATLFENAAVITGDGDFLPEADILVRGASIMAVGDSATFDLPEVMNRVDLSGRFLMPAMIDGHAHLGYQSPQGWGAEHYNRRNLLNNLRQYAYYGFAAVFSAGSDADDLALSFTAEQRESAGEAARMLFAAGMGPPGQGPYDAFIPEIRAVEVRTGATVLRGVSSIDDARARVREVADKGIPFIKIWVDDRGGGQDKLAQEIYRPLIDEATRHGISVFAHQQNAGDMPSLVAAGISGFLHGRLGPSLGEDVASTVARHGVFVVPNLGLGELRQETLGRDPFLRAVLTEERALRLGTEADQRRALSPPNIAGDRELRDSLAGLVASGVDIVLGTDAGGLPDHPFGYAGHRELEIFVRLGMTPMQALVAATGNAARHLRLTDLGLIAAGRRADFVVLDSNPLENIRNTRTINAVYLAGRRVDREAIARGLSSP